MTFLSCAIDPLTTTAFPLLFVYTSFRFTMAIRYCNHAGFMINTPSDSAASAPASVVETIQYGAAQYTLGTRGTCPPPWLYGFPGRAGCWPAP